jgi:hypothetical protein
MERIEQYAPSALQNSHAPSVLRAAFWLFAKRLIAVIVLSGLAYGLISVEVELAIPEQITEPYPR